MKISFVIPAHNEEHYIGQCLDALTKELSGRSDVDIIVANNNSTDRTREIVRQYPQVILVEESKPGANSAREAGYRASTGDLIANIDSDTIIRHGWLEHAEKEFRNHPNLLCLSGPFIYYDLPRGINMLVRLFYYIAFGVYVANRYIFKNSSMVQGGNFVVRRAALQKIGGFDTDISFYGDDADLARRLNVIGEVKFSFAFPIYASGRRLAQEGMTMTALRYSLNYFWIVLFKKPFTLTSNVVRPKQINGAVPFDKKATRKDVVVAFFVLIGLLLLVGGFAYLAYRLVLILLAHIHA